MLSVKLVFCVSIMIKGILLPAALFVAVLTLFAKPAKVRVIVFMAVDT